MRWLTLLTTLPPTPTRHRVGVWRKLQRMGAIRLRGSAWILPETTETTELFQWLVQEIEAFGGEATLLHVGRVGNMTQEQVSALFHKVRALEYQSTVKRCREVHGEDCTFETLIKRFGIKDRRAKIIAEIVHEADLHDGKFTRNESTGVDLAIKGLAEATQDDHDLLKRGMAIFDGLYTVLKRKT